MLNAKKGPMKTTAQNRSANSDGSVIARGPTFSLVNALVYVEHRPGQNEAPNFFFRLWNQLEGISNGRIFALMPECVIAGYLETNQKIIKNKIIYSKQRK